uniref:UmuC domain-containing protein n=1 Tax=Oryzias sinensis TaxID=183150 RepID=A0A8C8DV88_9TELE
MEYGKERVVALVDMDCFYVQVEQRLNPALRNTPCVVAQYKTWKGGGIIAVSYEARAHGVTRNMWVDDAKKLCPDLQVARVRDKNFPGKTSLATKEQVEPHLLHVPSHCLKFVPFDATMNDLRRYSTGSISWPWNWKKG